MADLKKWCEQRGWALAWGPLSLLADIQARFARLSASGDLDGEFARRELRIFTYPDRDAAGSLSRLLVLAVPRPVHKIGFELEEGRRLEALMPPTYVNYSRLPGSVRELLLAEVFPAATRLEPLSVPLKTLAARLGLVQYGLNNVTYVPNLGSYFQLVGYLTDAELPLPPDWQPAEPQLMPECPDCQLCGRACPTGAIHADRVLLHAETCLTLFSENAGECPRHMLPSGYQCLVGCLECQQTCPQNAGLLRVEPSGVVFDRKETSALLSGQPLASPVSEAIRAKMESLALAHYMPVLARNLANLVAIMEHG